MHLLVIVIAQMWLRYDIARAPWWRRPGRPLIFPHGGISPVGLSLVRPDHRGRTPSLPVSPQPRHPYHQSLRFVDFYDRRHLNDNGGGFQGFPVISTHVLAFTIFSHFIWSPCVVDIGFWANSMYVFVLNNIVTLCLCCLLYWKHTILAILIKCSRKKN